MILGKQVQRKPANGMFQLAHRHLDVFSLTGYQTMPTGHARDFEIELPIHAKNDVKFYSPRLP